MSNVVNFPSQKDPIDDVIICEITIMGNGDVKVWMNDYIETVEQHNWLISKIAASQSYVIRNKEEVLYSGN